MISTRKSILLGVAGLALLFGGLTGFEKWLARPAEGPACPYMTADEVREANLDFTPRFTSEKQLSPSLVRTARGEPFPDCLASNSAYRCTQTGPATVLVSLYGQAHYFRVDQGYDALVFGRKGHAFCVLTEPAANG